MASDAELISQDLTVSVNNGFAQYELKHVYQTFTENRTDGFAGPLTATGVPQRSQAFVLADIGVTVYCTSQRAYRVDTNATEKKWNVECTFTNFTSHFERDVDGNPVEDPTEAVKRVDVEWLEHSEPITNATLRGLFKDSPEFAGGSSQPTPQWLQKRQGVGDNDPVPGPILNSAGVPVLLERTNFRRVIKVSSIVGDWNNAWNDLFNKINEDEITIEESDSQGVRWSETFQPLTLRMRPPQKENVWKDGRLYYRLTFVIEHNPNRWVHSELDVGTKRRIFVGQNRPDEGTYSQEDLDSLGIGGEFGYEEITTKDAEGTKVAIGNPVLLNGHGMETPVPVNLGASPDSLYLDWNVHDIIPFAGLNL